MEVTGLLWARPEGVGWSVARGIHRVAPALAFRLPFAKLCLLAGPYRCLPSQKGFWGCTCEWARGARRLATTRRRFSSSPQSTEKNAEYGPWSLVCCLFVCLLFMFVCLFVCCSCLFVVCLFVCCCSFVCYCAATSTNTNLHCRQLNE